MLKVPTIGPAKAKILIVGESPGVHEERERRPFTSSAGQELSSQLHEVGILRSDCRLTYVCKYRPPGNKIDSFFLNAKKFIPGPLILEGIDELADEIRQCEPNVILALGNVALWALTGETSVSKWRGSQMLSTLVPGVKVIPTYKPETILKIWENRYHVINDLRRLNEESKDDKYTPPVYSFLLRPSFAEAREQLHGLLRRCESGPTIFSNDIETIAQHIACVGFGTSDRDAFCIPLISKEKPSGYFSPEQELEIILLFRDILTHHNARVIGQNYLYDTQFFARYYSFLPNRYRDTMLNWHVLFPGEPKGLDFLSSMLCDFHLYWKDELKDYNKYPEDESQFWNYNCKDCVITYEIAEKEELLLQKYNLLPQRDFLAETEESALRSMLDGVRVDLKYKNNLSLDLWDQMVIYENWFQQILPSHKPKKKGQSYWYNSPTQLQKLLYNDLQLPVQVDKKTFRPTTKDDALEKLKYKEPLVKELITHLQEYRSLGVFKRNFADAKLDNDGRIRCTYKVAGPETFRLASAISVFGTGTNLQNIPKGNE